MSFYSDEELARLGLKSYGKDVKISRNASFYGASNIALYIVEREDIPV